MKKKLSLKKITVSNLSDLEKSTAKGGATDQNTCPIICQGTAGCDCGMSDSCAPGTTTGGGDNTGGCWTNYHPMCV
jgi:hypothetical protein